MFEKRGEFIGHGAPVYSLAIHNDFLYSAAGDKFIARWNIETFSQENFAIRLDASAFCLCVHNDILYTGLSNGTICAIDLITRKVIWEHNFYSHPLFSLCFSETQNVLMCGDGASNFFLLSENGERLLTQHLNNGKIRQIKEIKDKIIVSTQLGNVFEFQTPSFVEIKKHAISKSSINDFLVNQNNELLCVSSEGYLFNFQLNNAIIQRQLPIHYQNIYSILKLENCFISCSLDKTIKIWTDDWKPIQKIESKNNGHSRSVNHLLKFNEQSFFSASDDKKIFFWEKIS